MHALIRKPYNIYAVLILLTVGLTIAVVQVNQILLFLPLVLLLWVYILTRWQRGINLLLLYLPFTGVVAYALYPSSYPVLFKDFLFLIPTYAAFFVVWATAKERPVIYVPILILATVAGLTMLVIVHMFNPGVYNWLMASIGAKVWLFYLPLLVLATVMVQTEKDVVRLFRYMVAIAWIPSVVGILQWIGDMVFGYEETMRAFYGDAAAAATQNFSLFKLGGGTIYRIPSTFTFVTQYFGYLLAMIVPCYALSRIDQSPRWRRFSLATLLLVVLASFVSGARAAFVFVPLLLLLIYLLNGRIFDIIRASILLSVLLLGAVIVADIDLGMLFRMMVELVVHYTKEYVLSGWIQAVAETPYGMGTGTNTGPARYAFEDPNSFIAFESYYVKAVHELGILGLFVVAGLFLLLVVYGFRAHQGLSDSKLLHGTAAILAFLVVMIINSFKGWQIDLDPINVYFWLFAGILLKIPYIKREQV